MQYVKKVCNCDHCRITAGILQKCPETRVVIGVADGSRTRLWCFSMFLCVYKSMT